MKLFYAYCSILIEFFFLVFLLCPYINIIISNELNTLTKTKNEWLPRTSVPMDRWICAVFCRLIFIECHTFSAEFLSVKKKFKKIEAKRPEWRLKREATGECANICLLATVAICQCTVKNLSPVANLPALLYLLIPRVALTSCWVAAHGNH